MAPPWAKKKLKRLQAAMRVLREEDPYAFGEIAEDYGHVLAALFLEPNHAIQRRSADDLLDVVEGEVSSIIEESD